MKDCTFFLISKHYTLFMSYSSCFLFICFASSTNSLCQISQAFTCLSITCPVISKNNFNWMWRYQMGITVEWSTAPWRGFPSQNKERRHFICIKSVQEKTRSHFIFKWDMKTICWSDNPKVLPRVSAASSWLLCSLSRWIEYILLIKGHNNRLIFMSVE